MAGCHGNDGQDRLWFERKSRANLRCNHRRLHRSLCDPADLDPRRDPADRLSRRRNSIAFAHRQSAVYPHAVRILSRSDGVGRALVARQELAGVIAVAALTPLYLLPPCKGQGYRMFRSISTRKLSSQAARLSLPRKEVFVSGWARAILRASRRITARLAGAWSF